MISANVRYIDGTNKKYAVSESGEVFSFAKGGVRTLKPILGLNGYLSVSLGRGRRAYIHRIVLETFVGPAGDGQETRHLDGNRTNNNLKNLCWGDRFEQSSDRGLHGTQKVPKPPNNRGSNNGMAKVTEELAALFKSCDLPEKILHERFGVARTTIRNIRNGYKWKHVKPLPQDQSKKLLSSLLLGE